MTKNSFVVEVTFNLYFILYYILHDLNILVGLLDLVRRGVLSVSSPSFSLQKIFPIFSSTVLCFAKC